MPPTARQSQAKKLEALKKQVAAQSRTIAAKDEQLAKLKEEAKTRNFEGKDDRIPIPEGQAGRGQGYNLFEEMRVSKETFHAIRTLVRHKSTRYLDITKSLRRQDKSNLRTAKLEIAKQIPFLIKYYHAAWPIGPIIKQFLWSSSKSYKKAREYLKHIKQVPAPLPPGAKTTTPRARAWNGNSSDEDELDRVPVESSDEDNPALNRLTPCQTTIKKAQKSLNASVDESSDEDRDPAACSTVNSEGSDILKCQRGPGPRCTDVSDKDNVPVQSKVKPRLTTVKKTQASLNASMDASDDDVPVPANVGPCPTKKVQKSLKAGAVRADANNDDNVPIPAKVKPRPTKKVQKADADANNEDNVPIPAKVKPRPTKKVQKSLKAGADANNETNVPVPAEPKPRPAKKVQKAGVDANNVPVPAKVMPQTSKGETNRKSNVVVSDLDIVDEPSNSELSDEDEFADGECAEEVEQLRMELEAMEKTQDSDSRLPKVSKDKFPAYCPNYDGETCNDKFPINPGARVKALFGLVQDIRHNPNAEKYSTGKPKSLELKKAELCLAIAAENKLRTDKGHSWPTNIDFSQLHNRILNLDKREIWGLLDNSIVLHNAVAWQTFIGKITRGQANLTFVKCSNMPAMQKFQVFGEANLSGYYGLAGQQIITATLQHHLYSQDKGADGIIAETMGEILETHGREGLPMYRFWSGSTSTTLSLLDFICYVAAPHIVNMLISMDQSVTETEADKIRLESCKHGSYYHDTTEEIDDLVMCIPKRQPNPLARNYSDHEIQNSSRHSLGYSNQVEITSNTQIQKAGPSQPKLDFTVKIPGRLARKQIQIAPLSSVPQKRSHDDKENEISDRLDLAEQAKKKKKRKGMQIVKSSGELRRSERHKDKA